MKSRFVREHCTVFPVRRIARSSTSRQSATSLAEVQRIHAESNRRYAAHVCTPPCGLREGEWDEAGSST
jgi:hypothetical protein